MNHASHAHLHMLALHPWLRYLWFGLLPLAEEIILNTPRACGTGNVTGCVYLSSSSSVSTKIARSGHLGIWATHNHDIDVEKLASLCFQSFGKPHERSKRCVLLTTPITTAQQAMCCSCAQYVGKGRQQGSRWMDPANVLCCEQDATRARYVLSRALVINEDGQLHVEGLVLVHKTSCFHAAIS